MGLNLKNNDLFAISYGAFDPPTHTPIMIHRSLVSETVLNIPKIMFPAQKQDYIVLHYIRHHVFSIPEIGYTFYPQTPPRQNSGFLRGEGTFYF